MTEPARIAITKRIVTIRGKLDPPIECKPCLAEEITVCYTDKDGQLVLDKFGQLCPAWIELRGLRIKQDNTISKLHTTLLYGRRKFEEGMLLFTAPRWAAEFAHNAASTLRAEPDRLKD